MPQVLEWLTLSGKWLEIKKLLPALGHPFSLRRLELAIAYARSSGDASPPYFPDEGAELSNAMLRALPPSLEYLEIEGFWEVEMLGEAMLPALEELHLLSSVGSRFELGAELPSLRRLKIDMVDEVLLSGLGLSLPRLTSLELMDTFGGLWEGYRAGIACESLPALASLTAVNMTAVTAPGGAPPAALSRLRHLTRLCAGALNGAEEWHTVAALLQLAPPSLWELDAGEYFAWYGMDGASAIIGPPLAGLTQPTKLSIVSPMGLLSYLSGMQRLRDLTLTRVESMTDEHLPPLAALRGLRRLECNGEVPAREAHAYPQQLEVSQTCCWAPLSRPPAWVARIA